MKPSGVDMKPSGVDMKPSGVDMKPSGVDMKPSGVDFNQPNFFKFKNDKFKLQLIIFFPFENEKS